MQNNSNQRDTNLSMLQEMRMLVNTCMFIWPIRIIHSTDWLIVAREPHVIGWLASNEQICNSTGKYGKSMRLIISYGGILKHLSAYTDDVRDPISPVHPLSQAVIGQRRLDQSGMLPPAISWQAPHL